MTSVEDRTIARLLAACLVAVLTLSCSRDAQTPAGRPPAAAAPARPQVIAEAKAEWPGLVVQVLDVSQTDGSLVVQFRFANSGTQPFPFGDRFAADAADRDTLADVTLTDVSGRRKYFILRDRANRPLCSANLTPLDPGESRVLFARFPAPLPGTSRITIQVPHVRDLGEVPISGQNGRGGV